MNSTTTALLIVDVQNSFCHPDGVTVSAEGPFSCAWQRDSGVFVAEDGSPVNDMALQRHNLTSMGECTFAEIVPWSEALGMIA